MTITEPIRARIIDALRKNKMTRSELSDRMGYQRPWATRLLNGKLESLTDENVEKLEKILGIEFFRITASKEEVSGLGIEVSNRTKNCPELVRAIQSVLELQDSQVWTPQYFTTKQLVGLGKEVIRIAHAEQDKPGKVGRKILEMVSQDPNKRKAPKQKNPIKERDDK